MAHAGGTLNDWLTASAYVRGRDETSAVLSRKKCRSRRRRAGSGSEVLHIESAQQAREMLISCKLGTRRYRRWMNDRLLRELAPPLDALEIGSLFAPPPWGEKSVVSPLERVTASPHDMALWEPFRNNVDMDLQAKLLQQADQRRKVSAKGKEGRLTAAFTAWSGVERNLRAALRRNSASPVLQELEDKLRTFMEGQEKELVLEMEAPYHRLLLHGLSQFHGLLSHTIQGLGDGGQSCATHILIRRRENACNPATLSLPQFLGLVQHDCRSAAAA